MFSALETKAIVEINLSCSCFSQKSMGTPLSLFASALYLLRESLTLSPLAARMPPGAQVKRQDLRDLLEFLLKETEETLEFYSFCNPCLLPWLSPGFPPRCLLSAFQVERKIVCFTASPSAPRPPWRCSEGGRCATALLSSWAGVL